VGTVSGDVLVILLRVYLYASNAGALGERIPALERSADLAEPAKHDPVR